MKRISIILILSVLFLSCGRESEHFVSKDKHLPADSITKKDTVTTKEVSKKTSKEELASDQDEITNTENKLPISTRKKESKEENSTPPPPDEVRIIQGDERKPPEVERKISWSEKDVTITYKKTVFPDPGVGCSASEEVFTIKLPIKGEKETFQFGIKELAESKFNYNYSGGLYGKASNGKPTAGSIKINKKTEEKWDVNISIVFPIEEFGGMEDKEKKESLNLKGVFK